MIMVVFLHGRAQKWRVAHTVGVFFLHVCPSAVTLRKGARALIFDRRLAVVLSLMCCRMSGACAIHHIGSICSSIPISPSAPTLRR